MEARNYGEFIDKDGKRFILVPESEFQRLTAAQKEATPTGIPLETFGQLIARLRKAKRLTQGELGRKAGELRTKSRPMTQATISRIENDESAPDAETEKALKKFFEIE